MQEFNTKMFNEKEVLFRTTTWLWCLKERGNITPPAKSDPKSVAV